MALGLRPPPASHAAALPAATSRALRQHRARLEQPHREYLHKSSSADSAPAPSPSGLADPGRWHEITPPNEIV